MRKEITIAIPNPEGQKYGAEAIKGTLAITVERRSRTKPRSNHPDFEDVLPRPYMYFYAQAFLDGESMEDTTEFYGDQALLDGIGKLEDDLIEKARRILGAKHTVTIEQKMKNLGYL